MSRTAAVDPYRYTLIFSRPMPHALPGQPDHRMEQFDGRTLEQARELTLQQQSPATIHDNIARKRGKIYPSGHIRWFS